MKTTQLWICIAVTVAGLPAGRALAQSSAPIVIGGDDKPWNQGVPVASREAARDLFLEGNRLFRIPLFTRAAEKYGAALRTWKHPAFYFNLALAQLNLGQDVEAHDSLEQALQHGAQVLKPDELREAQQQLADLERQLGRIRVTCPTQGAEVTLDGAPLFVGPGSQERWVTARAHEVTAKKTDYLSEARRVTVRAGGREELDLRLITLGEATHTVRRWAAWKPWLAVAAGGAIVATGGVLHAYASRNFNRFDEQFVQLECVTEPDPRAPGCAGDQIPSPLRDRLRSATRQQQLAVGSYIAGGALIATGVVLLYMNRPRQVEGPVESPARGVAVVPALSPDMLGVVLQVTH